MNMSMDEYISNKRKKAYSTYCCYASDLIIGDCEHMLHITAYSLLYRLLWMEQIACGGLLMQYTTAQELSDLKSPSNSK